MRLSRGVVGGAETAQHDRVVEASYWATGLEELNRLLREDAPRARLEIQRHLDVDLSIRPLPSGAGQPGHAFEIIGRVKGDSLLAVNQEAVRLRVVAGARNAECYTASETYWIDLR